MQKPISANINIKTIQTTPKSNTKSSLLLKSYIFLLYLMDPFFHDDAVMRGLGEFTKDHAVTLTHKKIFC